MNTLNNLTEQELKKRLSSLPEILSHSLGDKFNKESIQKICFAAGIENQEVVDDVVQTFALVVLGFIHIDDLPKILEEENGFPKEVAADVSLNIKAGLYMPLATDIEKIYSPLEEAKMPRPAVLPTPSVVIPPPPTQTPVVTPAPMPTPSPITTKPEMSAPKPAPFIISEQSTTAPVAVTSGFKLNLSKEMFNKNPTKPTEIPRPPKKAELELGKSIAAPTQKDPEKFTGIPTTNRVVHYTDLQTSKILDIPPAPIPSKPPEPSTPPPTPSPVAPVAPKVVNFGPEEVK